MTIRPVGEYELLAELSRTSALATFRGQKAQSDSSVHLTLFEPEISSAQGFRAAFRKDQPSLSNMGHHNVLNPLAWGESEGQLFFVTSPPSGQTLAQLISRGRFCSWDEFVDIGWQIASALQHAHNLGISHGHLTSTCVFVNDLLRVQVAEFGVYHWIAAAAPNPQLELSWSEQSLQDLRGLGRILADISHAIGPQAENEVDRDLLVLMQRLIDELQNPASDLTARDVQGRLGNMLLQEAGESIAMEDHRKGLHLSRRSIVDELFDVPQPRSHVTKQPTLTASPQAASSRVRIIVMLAVLLTLLAAAVAVLQRL